MLNMSIENGLSAHFKQPDGPSLPGTNWLVRIDRDGQTHRARVQALLSPDATRTTRRDQAYQARTTLGYLADQIEAGWDPADERDHTIHIGNPPGQRAQAWWKFW